MKLADFEQAQSPLRRECPLSFSFVTISFFWGYGLRKKRPNSGGTSGQARIFELTEPDMFVEPRFNRPAVSRRPFAATKASLARGFTLIEIMVVVVIIGVLAALIAPGIMGRTDEARQTAAKADINTLMQALKLYRTDNMRYPTSEQGLQALIARPTSEPVPTRWSRPYVEKLPNDPWGNPYVYINPGVYGEVDILSYGADGKAGGEGTNADIGSWQ